MAHTAQTITVALDMSKAFDTINIHTLIRKMLQTKIPGTIMKFIEKYIKGHKVYTTYRNHTSIQRQFKIGVPQGGVLSSTPFNIYTTDLPPPRAPVQIMSYADNITITSTQPTSGAAVTAVMEDCCANSVKTPAPRNGSPIYIFWGKLAMRTRWMAGTVPCKRVDAETNPGQQPHTNKSGLEISATNKYMVGTRYQLGATGLNTGCT